MATSKPKTQSKSAVVKDTISRVELTHAVQVASEVYRSNAMGVGVEGHTALTFDGKQLRANTFAAAIKIPLETKFKATINGQTLAKIVGAFENHGADNVDVVIKDSDMMISSGRSKVETVVMEQEAGDMNDMKGAVKLKVDADLRALLIQSMAQALRSAATNDVRHYLNGIHFCVRDGDLIVMGSDGLTACCVNTGIKGADKFNGMSLTRDTAESFIAIANRIQDVDDTMLFLPKKAFGWRFGNGTEICSVLLDAPDSFDLFDQCMGALRKLNVNNLPSVATPDGLADAITAGKVAATNGCPVFFSVKKGDMSVRTGDINTGLVYQTTNIETEVGDTDAAYDFALLTRIFKNPSDRILFYKDGPLYIGDVDIDEEGKGVRTFLMPMRV